MTKNTFKEPKVIFSDNFNDCVNYLCYLAQTIAQGNYQSNNYLVLSYLASHTHQTVYFPNLPYPKKFWQNIKKVPDTSVGLPFPRYVQSLIYPLTPKNSLDKQLTSIKTFWQKKKKNFWRELSSRKLLQKEVSKIDKIDILITEFGPGTSFNLITHGKKLDIFLTFRSDRGKQELLRSLIYVLVLIKTGKPGSLRERWQQIRTLVDFICEELSLPKPDSNLAPTKAILADNKSFLEKLGFGSKKYLIIKNNQIYLGERKISLRLSFNEDLILKELIRLNSNILSHDRISEILWEEKAADKFSLWGQTKLIQRLREKLANEGASPFLIQTVYRKGYLFEG